MRGWERDSHPRSVYRGNGKSEATDEPDVPPLCKGRWPRNAAGGIVFPDKFIGLIYEVMCGIKFVELLTEFGLILDLRGGTDALSVPPCFFDRTA